MHIETAGKMSGHKDLRSTHKIRQNHQTKISNSMKSPSCKLFDADGLAIATC